MSNISILTNTASLNAQRNLDKTQKSLAQNLSRLSSGERITKASDDAAGLGISEKMKASIRGYAQASRNANDGVSMIQVAEGAMNQQTAILTRLRELAIQSANGTVGADERGYIDNEAKELLGELDRISSVTDFNGVKILGANAGAVAFQVDLGATSGTDTISVTFTKTDSTTLAVKYGSGNDVDLKTSATTAQNALAKIDAAIKSLSGSRASAGAVQNRLEVTMSNLQSAHENLSAANSRIRDVDVASETAAMTRNQILSQAGATVLAQANQLPSVALSLLGR
jgi:flagellin